MVEKGKQKKWNVKGGKKKKREQKKNPEIMTKQWNGKDIKEKEKWKLVRKRKKENLREKGIKKQSVNWKEYIYRIFPHIKHPLDKTR